MDKAKNLNLTLYPMPTSNDVLNQFKSLSLEEQQLLIKEIIGASSNQIYIGQVQNTGGVQIIVNGENVFPALVKGMEDLLTNVFGETGGEFLKELVLQFISLKMQQKENKNN